MLVMEMLSSVSFCKDSCSHMWVVLNLWPRVQPEHRLDMTEFAASNVLDPVSSRSVFGCICAFMLLFECLDVGLKCFTVLFGVSLYPSELLLELSLTFCRLLTDTVRISSILPCQVKSMRSNGIPIHPLSTTLIPIPCGDDRFAGNDFLGLIFSPQKMWILKQTADWICLQGSLIVADFFFFSSTYWCLLTQLSGLLSLFTSVKGVRHLSCSPSSFQIRECKWAAGTCPNGYN